MSKLPKKYLFIDESGDAAFYAGGKKCKKAIFYIPYQYW